MWEKYLVVFGHFWGKKTCCGDIERKASIKQHYHKNITFGARISDARIKELEAAQVARVIPEVAFVVLNGNYALEAGLSVGKDSIAFEASDSTAAQTYVNIIAVKEGNENKEEIKALVDVLKSEKIQNYINETYDGAVVPFN